MRKPFTSTDSMLRRKCKSILSMRLLMILTTLLALLWILLWPVVCITTGERKCRSTFVSENALMPASARFTNYHSIIQDSTALAMSRRKDSATLKERMKEVVGCDPRKYHRTEYCIIRPKTASDRREAIVLVAFRRDWAGFAENATRLGSVDLLLEIGKILKHQTTWLSKNVVLLFPDDVQSVKEWTDMYHSSPLSSNSVSEIEERLEQEHAGILRGAIIVESPLDLTSPMEALAILIHGKNGHLPNLDLYNTATRVVGREIPLVMDKHSGDDYFRRLRKQVGELTLDDVIPDKDVISKIRSMQIMDNLKDFAKLITVETISFGQYLDRLENMFRFIHRGAFGPTGIHSFFIENGVDALTFSLVKKSPTRSSLSLSDPRFPMPDSPMDSTVERLADACSSIEQLIRSVSNLEERLHASFYLYLLPSTNLFVSIHEYAGSMILLLLPIPLMTVQRMMQWVIELRWNAEIPTTKSKFPFDVCMEVSFGMVCALLAHALGFLLFSAFATASNPWQSSRMFICSIFILMVAGFVALSVLRNRAIATIKCRVEALDVDKAVANDTIQEALTRVRIIFKLTFLGVFFIVQAAMGLWNFPFAIVTSLVYAPILIVSKPISSGWIPSSIVRLVYTVAVSIPVILYVFPHLVVEQSFWSSRNHGADSLSAAGSIGAPLDMIFEENKFLAGMETGANMIRNGYMDYGYFHFGYLTIILFPLQLLHLYFVLFF